MQNGWRISCLFASSHGDKMPGFKRPGEVEIDYGQDEIDGSTVEYLLATSFAKPSVDSITMSYNCVPDEAGQHSNRR